MDSGRRAKALRNWRVVLDLKAIQVSTLSSRLFHVLPLLPLLAWTGHPAFRRIALPSPLPRQAPRATTRLLRLAPPREAGKLLGLLSSRDSHVPPSSKWSLPQHLHRIPRSQLHPGQGGHACECSTRRGFLPFCRCNLATRRESSYSLQVPLQRSTWPRSRRSFLRSVRFRPSSICGTCTQQQLEQMPNLDRSGVPSFY